MNVSVFIATSLDGFIARPDGDIDWLMEASQKAIGEDMGYESFMAMSDYLIMGRNSYEKVLSFDEWPYEGQKVIVISSTLKSEDIKLEGVELFSGALEDLVARLRDAKCGQLYIDGGRLIQSFLNQNLITDMTITTIPILLGSGISLFGAREHDVPLELEFSKSFPSGFVQNKYTVGQN